MKKFRESIYIKAPKRATDSDSVSSLLNLQVRINDGSFEMIHRHSDDDDIWASIEKARKSPAFDEYGEYPIDTSFYTITIHNILTESGKIILIPRGSVVVWKNNENMRLYVLHADIFPRMRYRNITATSSIDDLNLALSNVV